jgi:hypothetical protein
MLETTKEKKVLITITSSLSLYTLLLVCICAGISAPMHVQAHLSKELQTLPSITTHALKEHTNKRHDIHLIAPAAAL